MLKKQKIQNLTEFNTIYSKKCDMKLNPNWIAEGTIDFEYKQYILLAYLQRVECDFHSNKLFPHLIDLVTYYRDAVTLKNLKNNMFKSFKQELIGVDILTPKLIYLDSETELELFKTIDKILEFAITEFMRVITEGLKIYDVIWDKIKITELSIPININRDYGFLIVPNLYNISVYEYELSILADQNNDRLLTTNLVREYENIPNVKYESITLNMGLESKIKNPTTFIIKTIDPYPLTEVLLPLCKRKLIILLSQPNIS